MIGAGYLNSPGIYHPNIYLKHKFKPRLDILLGYLHN